MFLFLFLAFSSLCSINSQVLENEKRPIHRVRRAVLNVAEMTIAVDTHNRLRGQVGSSDMRLLTWNDELASMANDWAATCQFAHGQPFRAKPIYNPPGQNLYGITNVGPLNIGDAITAWYNETYGYNYDTAACSLTQNGGTCNHYVQLAFANNFEIGCAYTLCPWLSVVNLTNAYNLVCNYGPGAGVGKPFKKGKACSQCSSDFRWCINGLCASSCPSPNICACALNCQNGGNLTSTSCTCTCPPKYSGSDCSVGSASITESHKLTQLLWAVVVLFFTF